MKKLISLALAVVMIISLSTTAFAETVEAPGSSTMDVTASYEAGWESNGIVYSVTIEWSDLDFTYHAEKGAVWDPETLEYSETVGAYWEGEGKITVTNRSNTKITAVPEYAAAEGYSDATMTFDTDKLRVETAELGAEQTGTITVTPGGFLPVMEESGSVGTIGTITLTIAQDTDINAREVFELEGLAYTLYQDCGKYEMMESADEDEFAIMLGMLDVLKNSAEQDDINRAYADLLAQYNHCLELIKKYQ